MKIYILVTLKLFLEWQGRGHSPLPEPLPKGRAQLITAGLKEPASSGPGWPSRVSSPGTGLGPSLGPGAPLKSPAQLKMVAERNNGNDRKGGKEIHERIAL